jgi:hypothetical protein
MSTAKVGSRVLAPWSDAGDRQEGTITSIRLRAGQRVATVLWDDHPGLYAGESDLVVSTITLLEEVAR